MNDLLHLFNNGINPFHTGKGGLGYDPRHSVVMFHPKFVIKGGSIIGCGPNKTPENKKQQKTPQTAKTDVEEVSDEDVSDEEEEVKPKKLEYEEDSETELSEDEVAEGEDDEEDEEEIKDIDFDYLKDKIDSSDYYSNIEILKDLINSSYEDEYITNKEKKELNKLLEIKKQEIVENAGKRIIPSTLEISKAKEDIASFPTDLEKTISDLKEAEEALNDNIDIPSKIPKYFDDFYTSIKKNKKSYFDFIDANVNQYSIKKITDYITNNKLKITGDKISKLQDYLLALEYTDNEKPVSPASAFSELKEIRKSRKENIKSINESKKNLELINLSNIKKVEEYEYLQKKLGKSETQISQKPPEEIIRAESILNKKIDKISNEIINLNKKRNDLINEINDLEGEDSTPDILEYIHELRRELSETERNINKSNQTKKELENKIEKDEEKYIFKTINRELSESERQQITSLLNERDEATDELTEINSEAYENFKAEFIDNEDIDFITPDEKQKLEYIFTKGSNDIIYNYYKNETDLLEKTLTESEVHNKMYRGFRSEANENFERVISVNDTDEKLSPANKKLMDENRKILMKEITGKTTGKIYIADDYLSYEDENGDRQKMPSADSFAIDAVRNPTGDSTEGEAIEFKKYTDTIHSLKNLLTEREKTSGLSIQIFKNEIIRDMKQIKDMRDEYNDLEDEDILTNIEKQKETLKRKIDTLNSLLKIENNNEDGTLEFLLDKAKINNEFSHKYMEPVGIEIGINKFGDQPVYNPLVSPNSIKDAKQLLKEQGTDYLIKYNDKGRINSIKSNVVKNKEIVEESIQYLYEFNKNYTYDLIFVVGVKDSILKFNYSEYLRKLKTEAEAKGLKTIDEHGNLIYSGYNIFRISPDFYDKTKAKSLLIPIHLWTPLDLSKAKDLTFLPSTKKE